MKRRIRDEIFKDNKVVYIIAIMISLCCIGASFIPYGIKQGEGILQGLGCSGVSAALMAIFIEKLQNQREKNRREEDRQFLLADLNQELKQFIERIIWFDEAVKILNLDKELQYYHSLEFIQEANELELYRVMEWEAAEKTVQKIMKYYDKREWLIADEGVLLLNVPYMFKIIASASKRIQLQVDKLYENRVYLITNNVLKEEEILSIYRALNHQVDFLECSTTNYATSISFITHAYKYIRGLGGYNDKFYITWQPGKEIMELCLEDRIRRKV